MSNSEVARGNLFAAAAEGTLVTIVDADLRPVARGLGKFQVELDPGLYKVRFEAGPSREEKIVEVARGGTAHVAPASLLVFPSPVPYADTSRTHEYHTDLARRVSANKPNPRLGSGGRLLFVVRSWMRDEERTAPPNPPERGLRLLDGDGKPIIEFANRTEAERIPGDEQTDGAYAIHVELDPGNYLLELVRPWAGDKLRQTVVVTAGWQTQYFAFDRPVAGGPNDPPQRAADLTAAAVYLSRGSFQPDQHQGRLTELLRLALSSGQELAPADLRRSFLDKFENPMLGILAAHIVLRNDAALSDDQTEYLGIVLENLSRLGVGEHPDVRALGLRLNPDTAQKAFEVPPMLLASWDLVRRATVDVPELVPGGSELARGATSLWGSGPWMCWVQRPQPELVLESVNFERSRNTFDRDVERRLRRAADRFGSREPSRKAMAAVAEDLGVPFGEIERSMSRLGWRTRVAPAAGTNGGAMNQHERARQISEFLRTIFPRDEDGGLSAVHPDDLRQKYLESTGARTEEVATAVKSVQRALEGMSIAEEDVGAVEAIVLKDECPTFEIANDKLPEIKKGRWKRLGTDAPWINELIPSAGRVDCEALFAPYAGSGFLVADDLVMTNRHVARLFAHGIGLKSQIRGVHSSEIDYRSEKSAPGVRKPTNVTGVELIHPYWDVALLRVKPIKGRKPLELASSPPRFLEKRQVAVIGYPYFQFTDSEYETKVLLDNFGDTPGFKRLQPGRLTHRIDYQPEGQEFPKVLALGHNASTLGGNSGSLVLDLDSRKVIGVHFAGQPFVTNWCVPTWELFKDPRIRDLGVKFDAQTGASPPSEDALAAAAWKNVSAKPSFAVVPENIEKDEPEPTLPVKTAEGSMGVQVVLNISGDEIRSVHFERGRVAAREAAVPEAGALETTKIDPDWSSRSGYDSEFLEMEVPLPALSAKQKEITVEVPKQYRVEASEKYILPYHHYSIAFNGKRRQAWFSAANVDGDRRFTFKRGKDRWYIDPRIDDPKKPKHQMGEELYAAKNTDRGHLTRYLDVAWGDSEEEALDATADSFHFTNCSLQLDGFNQGKDRWQGLEQFILENKARKEKRRMNVFTGPVFKRTDPVYQNEFMKYSIRVPLEFWKVCTIIREDGSLSATGFLLGQPDVAELPGFEEKFDAGAAQVTVAHLEKLTGLSFGDLKSHDPFAAGGGAGRLETTLEGAKFPVRPLRSLEDIQI